MPTYYDAQHVDFFFFCSGRKRRAPFSRPCYRWRARGGALHTLEELGDGTGGGLHARGISHAHVPPRHAQDAESSLEARRRRPGVAPIGACLFLFASSAVVVVVVVVVVVAAGVLQQYDTTVS